MANNYDRIFKENIESMLLPLLEKVLGLIPPKLVPIDAKMQMTHESEMDNIRRVVHEEDAALDYGLTIANVITFKKDGIDCSNSSRSHDHPLRHRN